MPSERAGWVASLIDLVLPPECAGCAAPSWRCCPQCAHQLAIQLSAGPAPHTPQPPPPGFPPTWVAGAYQPPLATMIRRYKDGGRTDLRRPLAVLLGAVLQTFDTGLTGDTALLVPMPSSRAATRARGRQPLLDLVQSIGRSDTTASVLRFRGRVRDQTELDCAARYANISRHLELSDPGRLLQGRRVILVDDVVTSGATLAVAAQLSYHADARSVVAATIAATQRRR